MSSVKDRGLPDTNLRVPMPPVKPPRASVVRVIFDGPPGPEAGRFVECEDDTGRSIRAGAWTPLHDGLWELRIDLDNIAAASPVSDGTQGQAPSGSEPQRPAPGCDAAALRIPKAEGGGVDNGLSHAADPREGLQGSRGRGSLETAPIHRPGADLTLLDILAAMFEAREQDLRAQLAQRVAAPLWAEEAANTWAAAAKAVRAAIAASNDAAPEHPRSGPGDASPDSPSVTGAALSLVAEIDACARSEFWPEERDRCARWARMARDLGKAPPWRDAQKDPPPYGERVLVANRYTEKKPHWHVAAGERSSTNKQGESYCFDYHGESDEAYADWWQPLPAPPAEAAQS